MDEIVSFDLKKKIIKLDHKNWFSSKSYVFQTEKAIDFQLEEVKDSWGIIAYRVVAIFDDGVRVPLTKTCFNDKVKLEHQRQEISDFLGLNSEDKKKQ
jgi:hypothetical protein